VVGENARTYQHTRGEEPFWRQGAQPFTTADPHSKPTSIFCRPG
jgi:hypothetical protein